MVGEQREEPRERMRRPRHAVDVETNVAAFVSGHDERLLAALGSTESVP